MRCGVGTNPCPSSVSSYWTSAEVPTPRPASLALDGDTTSTCVTDSIANTAQCNYFHTDCNKANEWWMVDLQAEYQIASVRIYNRVSNWAVHDRFQGAEIRVGNSNSFDGNQACATNLPGDPVIAAVCSATGRYLFVVQPRSDTCLHFAEIEVYESGTSAAGATSCTSCVAGTYSSAGASRVCLLRYPVCWSVIACQWAAHRGPAAGV